VSRTGQTTSAEHIRLELARSILSGGIAPGTVLDETELAEGFAVSRTPVREALRQLASSGLVQQRPHRKTVVTKPDGDTLRGMFAVMGYLEALCAGLCATEMTAGERSELERIHRAMAEQVRQGDIQAYTEANERFHAAIYQGTHNAYLAEISLATRQRVQPFRRAQFGALGRLTASHAEHGAIVEAILRGDREAAEHGMKQHIGLVEGAYHRLADTL